MPSPRSADHPAVPPPQRDTVDALISQTQRLRGGLDAVRRDTVADLGGTDDAQVRWQRALCELAVHQLDDLDRHLGELREGLLADPPRTDEGTKAEADATGTDGGTEADAGVTAEAPAGSDATGRGSLLSRVGSAEWNLLSDEVTWSDELCRIFGRDPGDGGLTLDELPSWVFSEDQPILTTMVTDCLVDGKPIDGEFRVVRADEVVRTIHMAGEPVLDTDGSTASMWAVLRDVSELRRSERAVRESRDTLSHQRRIARTERRLAVEVQEAVLPPWRGSLRLPAGDGFPGAGPAADGAALDLAAHYLPSESSAQIGGDWYDALELPDGRTLLSVGGLTGHGVTATCGMAMLLGAVRGMAVAGIEPGPLMGRLNQLLAVSSQPALVGAACGQYDPRTRTLVWAQAGHPAPLLFRDGTGRPLRSPDGVLLGATTGAAYTQSEERLEPGDLLVLYTGRLARDAEGATERLLALAPRLTAAHGAQECVRTVAETFGDEPRGNDACVLIARVTGVRA
ncbi:SpoIIE family protein phosphatase [Streptomyces sp. 11-1-2]|uniref:PP2C family protein-serine/threonine phosphatase n=1 Tax=unclassified Streptomyces TaxID=2593676 RepID=UPI000B8D3219|nr:SpoIIE family protein phosphatase [Streptomyces sp. 11-1-2]ASQ99070.1 phosphatase [Streptomyces sp. 11-1-2]